MRNMRVATGEEEEPNTPKISPNMEWSRLCDRVSRHAGWRSSRRNIADVRCVMLCTGERKKFLLHETGGGRTLEEWLVEESSIVARRCGQSMEWTETGQEG